MSLIRCMCGEVNGTQCESLAHRGVLVEWIPEGPIRENHTTAGNRGVYPHNGAYRLLCHPDCAAQLVADDPDWCTIVDDSERWGSATSVAYDSAWESAVAAKGHTK